MRLGIVHLSDLHALSEGNIVQERASKVVAAIRPQVQNSDAIFLVLSGDIAFSGLSDEYLQAKRMIDEIVLSCARYMPEVPVNVIMVPGNHDCDFSGNQSLRDLVLRALQSGDNMLEPDLIDVCCSPQSAYFSMADAYASGDTTYRDKLFASKSFELAGKHIVFYTLNTAWMSRKEEAQGILRFPIETYVNTMEGTTADLVVAVMHHPDAWFYTRDSREIRRQISQHCDLVLVGHEHVAGAYQRDDLQQHRIEYIEGGALQTDADDTSEFNLVLFDDNPRTRKVLHFAWSTNHYSSELESEWESMRLSPTRRTREFELRESFASLLDDPGMRLGHPQKADIHLEDIYIYPDGRKVNRSPRQDALEHFVSLSTIVQDHATNARCIIIGEEKSGKTALCKVIYKELYNRDLVPVLLDGVDVTTPVMNDFDKLLANKYSEQYRTATAEQYAQLDDDRKVILIDNLDHSRLNNRSTLLLVERLSDKYRNIVITGSSLFQFMELMGSDEHNEVNEKYVKFQIDQFGHKLRFDLIDKWNRLGREFTIEECDLTVEDDRVQRIMDNIIGSNFVPAYPFFLLVILQNVESGAQDSLRDSSYGHYYEFLIKSEFISTRLGDEDIDALYSYLSELAFMFFRKKQREINGEDFDAFDAYFCSKYALESPRVQAMRRVVLLTAMAGRHQGSYEFRYAYMYYYFVARYITQHLTEAEIKDTVAYMCENVHVEQFASILMFVTHASSDPFILDQVLSQARAIFEQVEAAKLEGDIEGINKLSEALPRLVFDGEGSARARRRERLAEQDTQLRAAHEVGRDTGERTRSEVAAADEAEGLPEMFATVFGALKMVEILGQILKTYYGSTVGERKLELCNEAYNVGLRALSAFISAVTNDTDTIISEIQNVMAERYARRSREEREEMAKRFVFTLATLVSYVFLKRIAASVGARSLRETFRSAAEANSSVAVKIIDMSIKLDYFQAIPFGDLERFKETTHGNTLGYTLARLLVIDYLYMFEVDFQDRQRVADLLDIAIQTQRTIQITSRRKKVAHRKKKASRHQRKMSGRKTRRARGKKK